MWQADKKKNTWFQENGSHNLLTKVLKEYLSFFIESVIESRFKTYRVRLYQNQKIGRNIYGRVSLDRLINFFPRDNYGKDALIDNF